jgi:hypothetical protein
MKQTKKLVLATLLAAALMGFAGAGSAAATALYHGATKLGAGQVIDFSLAPGGSGLMVNTKGEQLDTCATTTIKLALTSAGSSTTTVKGEATELTQSNCNFPTKTIKMGSGEIHHIAGTTNGLVTAASSIEYTINTVLFGECIYGVTNGVSLGTLTGGNPPTFHSNAVVEKFSGSNFACPETGKWSGTYVGTEPAGDLHVEES